MVKGFISSKGLQPLHAHSMIDIGLIFAVSCFGHSSLRRKARDLPAVYTAREPKNEISTAHLFANSSISMACTQSIAQWLSSLEGNMYRIQDYSLSAPLGGSHVLHGFVCLSNVCLLHIGTCTGRLIE